MKRDIDITLVQLDEASLAAWLELLGRHIHWLTGQPRRPDVPALLEAIGTRAHLLRNNALELVIEANTGQQLAMAVPAGRWSWR